MRNLVFNEQMAAIFAAEIGIALLVLFTVGVIAMHLRARHLNRPVTIRHYLVTGAFSAFIACILAFTLTPIRVDGSYATPTCTIRACMRAGAGAKPWSRQKGWD